jgi:LacI family transcriptional regulator
VLAHTVSVGTLEHIARRIPVVLLAGRQPHGDGAAPVLDHLLVANEAGAHEVTTHLLNQHGYAEIGFVAGPPDSPDSASRFDGYRRAMTERGLTVPEHAEWHGDFTTAGGRGVTADILARGRPPRALVCANDQTAIGVMTALRQAGLQVPADVAVTGFDGIQLGEHLRPSLTTVVQPMREFGQAAVRLLEERMDDGSALPRTVELGVRLAVRASCGCPEPLSRPAADQRSRA